MNDFILEACVETLGQAEYALLHGAHQLEVCSHLEADGLTPDITLLEKLDPEHHLAVKPMIRCRAGDFNYTADELSIMVASVEEIRSRCRVIGFVFGALTVDEDGHLQPDLKAVRAISEAARGIPLTFHKAIDLCTDLPHAVRQLAGIPGVRYILSSGGARTAAEGAEMLSKMQLAAGSSIDIIAAGKVTRQNVEELAAITGLTMFHGRQIV